MALSDRATGILKGMQHGRIALTNPTADDMIAVGELVSTGHVGEPRPVVDWNTGTVTWHLATTGVQTTYREAPDPE